MYARPEECGRFAGEGGMRRSKLFAEFSDIFLVATCYITRIINSIRLIGARRTVQNRNRSTIFIKSLVVVLSFFF